MYHQGRDFCRQVSGAAEEGVASRPLDSTFIIELAAEDAKFDVAARHGMARHPERRIWCGCVRRRQNCAVGELHGAGVRRAATARTRAPGCSGACGTRVSHSALRRRGWRICPSIADSVEAKVRFHFVIQAHVLINFELLMMRVVFLFQNLAES